MVVVVDTVLAEQAMPVLLQGYCFFHASLAVQRAALILPTLYLRVVHCHEGKLVQFKDDLCNRQYLPYLLHSIQMRYQQVVCGWCQPSYRTLPVGEASFFVPDALTCDRFGIARQ